MSEAVRARMRKLIEEDHAKLEALRAELQLSLESSVVELDVRQLLLGQKD